MKPEGQMNDVILTNDEGLLVGAVLMGRFGAIALPAAYAHILVTILDKLPGIEPYRPNGAGATEGK